MRLVSGYVMYPEYCMCIYQWIPKYNFYDPLKPDWVELKSVNETVTNLGVSVNTYYSAF